MIRQAQQCNQDQLDPMCSSTGGIHLRVDIQEYIWRESGDISPVQRVLRIQFCSRDTCASTSFSFVLLNGDPRIQRRGIPMSIVDALRALILESPQTYRLPQCATLLLCPAKSFNGIAPSLAKGAYQTTFSILKTIAVGYLPRWNVQITWMRLSWSHGGMQRNKSYT